MSRRFASLLLVPVLAAACGECSDADGLLVEVTLAAEVAPEDRAALVVGVTAHGESQVFSYPLEGEELGDRSTSFVLRLPERFGDEVTVLIEAALVNGAGDVRAFGYACATGVRPGSCDSTRLVLVEPAQAAEPPCETG